MKLPAAPPAERPAADVAPGAPPQAAPPDALFAALMNLITARTAPAEGQTPDTPVALPEKPTPTQTAAGTAATLAPADGLLLGALLAALKPTATAPAPVPAPAAASDCATPASAAVPAMPAHPTTHAEKAAPVVPATPALPPVAATPVVPTTLPSPGKDPAPRDGQGPADEDKAPAKAAAPASRAPLPEPPLLAGEAVAPKDRGAVRAADAPRPVLRPERLEALVRLATRQGAAEAHMELHPQELGAVVVKLRVTSDGLNATLTATNPDAVAQLQQAGDDLRRALEAKGITLATLDVRAQSSETGDRREQRGWDRTRERRRAVGHVDDELGPVTTSIPVGELVDVHA